MSVSTSILEFFPFDTPRSAQGKVIKAVSNAFANDYRYVILESPVGSGKSAMAMTIARFYGESHILTPRKSLQDQYYEDFKQFNTVVMKGRSSYPCTFEAQYMDMGPEYEPVVKKIEAGEIIRVSHHSDYTTAEGPCLLYGEAGQKFKRSCSLGDERPCPYHVAIDVAQEANHIIHNLHGFIFQAHFAARFQKRKLLVIDEAHDLPGIVRGFTTKNVSVPRLLHACPEMHPSKDASLDEWYEWFTDARMLPANEEVREKYLASCDALKDSRMRDFVVSVTEDNDARRTKCEFTPISIGDSPENLILKYGEKVLLMSGTIYNKEFYCRQIGIDPNEAHFIRVPSSFPVENRPVYMKKAYMVDTSHRNWSKNLPQLGIRIKKVMNVFRDVKGLIHVPSYYAAQQLIDTVEHPRLVTHTKENFQSSLQAFYASNGNDVFVSPVCQQGVDFKGDRARFQIITRIPYLNTSDPFVQHQVQNDFNWYNYQALVIFGQQIGRVNRSEDDFGVTILMDQRFESFVRKNRNRLPKWLMDAIITG